MEHYSVIGEFYNKYRTFCYGIAKRFVKSPAIADEIVQRCFFNIIKAAHPRLPDNEDEAKRFMAAVVRRECITHLRHEKHVLNNVKEEQYLGEMLEKIDQSEQTEARLAVHEAINKLSAQDQTIAWRVLAEECNISEVAEDLGVRRDYVTSRLRRPIIPYLRWALQAYRQQSA